MWKKWIIILKNKEQRVHVEKSTAIWLESILQMLQYETLKLI